MASSCPICNNPLNEGEAACPLCGYHLLGETTEFNPIALQPEGLPPQEAQHRYDLSIVRGPHTGMAIDLHPGTLTVGRDPRCDIFLNDMTVSRNHASFEVGEGGCIIRDNGSVNGVWVNNRMVEASLLKAGDLLQIGAFCLLYRERPWEDAPGAAAL